LIGTLGFYLYFSFASRRVDAIPLGKQVMSSSSLGGTALKMKDHCSSSLLYSKPSSQKAKQIHSTMAGSTIKKSTADTQEIIDIDGGEEIGNSATDKLTNKGAVKPQDTDKENGANSGFEDDEGGVSPYIDEVAKQRELSSIRRRKINDFITDKAYRVRSFLRRRGVPLTRTTEMDIQGCAKMLILGNLGFLGIVA
jgi:hypothetical protein